MNPRAIDTNILIQIWHGQLPGTRRVTSEVTARAAAEGWLRRFPDDVLLTPVRLEFLAGTRDRDELRLADLFLDQFPLADGGRVLPEDWRAAERYARRVPFDGRSRGVVDCLIVAICDRLHLGVRTDDTGMPRR